MELDHSFSAVEIEINHSCNRSCSYCPNSIFERKNQGEIDPALFTKLMTELAELGFKGRISYHFYNEPMLHTNLVGIVKETRAFLPKARIELYTNGTLLTLSRFRILLEAGISKFIVTRHEADQQHRFGKTYEQLSAQEQSCVEYQDFSRIRLTNRGGILPHLGNESKPLLPCLIPSFLVTVTVSGNVLPCFEDFHENQVMGNLADSTLVNIWNSDQYTEFRRLLKFGQRHRFTPCRGCNRREVLPCN